MTATEPQAYYGQAWQNAEHSTNTPPESPFNADELCNKLEAHRVDVKLAEIRERAAKRRQSAALNPTYKPRYSFFGGSISIPETPKDENSTPIDFATAREGEWPEWVNPKAMLEARSRGMSTADARRSILGPSEDQLETQRKLKNRTSLMFGPWAEKSSVHSSRARPMSMSVGHGVRSSISQESMRQPQTSAGNARSRNRFSSQPNMRAQWNQADAPKIDPNEHVPHGLTPELQARFRQKLANLPPIQVAEDTNDVQEHAQGSVSSASSSRHEAPALKRPLPSSQPSAVDSAVDVGMSPQKPGPEKEGKRLRLKKSIRNLFGRKQ